jgi:transcriptional regulator with XRE-family HTH domain
MIHDPYSLHTLSVSEWDTQERTLMDTTKHYLQRGREALGLSRDDVADALGVKPRTIKAWELGTRSPRDGYGAWAKYLIGAAETVISDTLEARRAGNAPASSAGPHMLAIVATTLALEAEQAAEMADVYGQRGATALRQGQANGVVLPSQAAKRPTISQTMNLARSDRPTPIAATPKGR